MENNEMFENLSRILGENNIPDNLKDVLKNLNTNSNNSSTTEPEAKSENNSNSSISPEMIQNLLNMLNSNAHSGAQESNSNNTASNIDMEMILKMKSIMDKMNSNKEDPRASLLLSLKPYLKDSRKNKVEQYIKLFNMTKVIEAFNSSGGDSK